MKEFVEYLTRNLVDHPDEIMVTEVSSASSLIIEIRLNKKDIGKVIGKEGKTINAIRTITHSIAAKSQMRMTIQIIE